MKLQNQNFSSFLFNLKRFSTFSIWSSLNVSKPTCRNKIPKAKESFLASGISKRCKLKDTTPGFTSGILLYPPVFPFLHFKKESAKIKFKLILDLLGKSVDQKLVAGITKRQRRRENPI